MSVSAIDSYPFRKKLAIWGHEFMEMAKHAPIMPPILINVDE